MLADEGRTDEEVAEARQVKVVRVLPLHGSAVERTSIDEAIDYIEHYSEDEDPHPFVKYEIEVVYNNGNEINGQFQDKQSAVEFLRNFASPTLRST